MAAIWSRTGEHARAHELSKEILETRSAGSAKLIPTQFRQRSNSRNSRETWAIARMPDNYLRNH